MNATLRWDRLSVGYGRNGSVEEVVHEVDLMLEPGRIVGLAGESGCGKSTASLAGIGFRAGSAVVTNGHSWLGEVDVTVAPVDKLRPIWGSRIAYISQSASGSLNPALTVERQFRQPLREHLGLSKSECRARAEGALDAVAVPNPQDALRRYPHEFSGGQKQRVVLALALALEPEVLILDEPTTGLDVTTQAQISALIRQLVNQTGVAALYVSHDLALLGSLCDRLVVLYAGEILEQGPAREVLADPCHPYTRALLDSVPSARGGGPPKGIPGLPPPRTVGDSCSFTDRCAHAIEDCRETKPGLIPIDADRAARCILLDQIPRRDPLQRSKRPTDIPEADSKPLLRVDSVSCFYRSRRREVAAVKDVSLEVGSHELLGLVGESGSGKSTLLRSIAGLHGWSQGSVTLSGNPLDPAVGARSKVQRRQVQLIFQDPDSSLNPRRTIAEIIRRPLRILREDVDRAEEDREIDALLESVALAKIHRHRFPRQLSGGQKQRVAIARALAAKPKLLLCDEITSSLDVSVQATIVSLLLDLAHARGLGILFVTHDLSLVSVLTDRVIVMRDGSVCEEGSTSQLFTRPKASYTRELLAALPDLPAITGSPRQAGGS